MRHQFLHQHYQCGHLKTHFSSPVDQIQALGFWRYQAVPIIGLPNIHLEARDVQQQVLLHSIGHA